jgi:hypothetical protein
MVVTGVAVFPKKNRYGFGRPRETTRASVRSDFIDHAPWDQEPSPLTAGPRQRDP